MIKFVPELKEVKNGWFVVCDPKTRVYGEEGDSYILKVGRDYKRIIIGNQRYISRSI